MTDPRQLIQEAREFSDERDVIERVDAGLSWVPRNYQAEADDTVRAVSRVLNRQGALADALEATLDERDAARAETQRLRDLLSQVRAEFASVARERSHGLTASAVYIDLCIDAALRLLDDAHAAPAEETSR